MRPATIEKLAGTTLKVTVVNSGATVSPISSALFDRNESLVNSIAAVSSSNGFYYALHLLPNSAQWMINEWRGVISTNTYVERQFVRVRTMETD